MCLKVFIKKSHQKQISNNKTLKDLDVFDTIWVKDGEIIQEGWIYDISRRCVVVVYGNSLEDYRFRLVKPLTASKLIQGDKILYCNKPI